MTIKLDNDTLEWAAQWIEGSLKGESDQRVKEFGKNMAMTLRAAVPPAPVHAAGDDEGESRLVLLTTALTRIEEVATAGERATTGDAAERFKWIKDRAAVLRSREGETNA